MKRWLVGAMAGAVALLGGMLAVNPVHADPAPRTDVRSNVIGVWKGDTGKTAPYRWHLITFHGDGTVDISNPTNVQQTAGYGKGTTDSKGSGVWYYDTNKRAVVWWFTELNSNALTHRPAADTTIVFVVRFPGFVPTSRVLDGPWMSAPDEEHIGTIHMTKLGVTQSIIDDVPGS